MNLISLDDWSASRAAAVIDLAIRIKNHPAAHAEALKGKKMYMLFEKTSTRTALGLGFGFRELGGDFFSQRWAESNFAVGDLRDETRYVARNVDLIMARLKRHQDIETMGRYSPVPVINGCCDAHHPTQALADCMAIKELFGTYEKTILYVGIWNNVFNSLLGLFPRLGGKLIGFCPIANGASVSAEDIGTKTRTVPNFEYFGAEDATRSRLKGLVAEADVVYVDTWVDMEFFENPAYAAEREKRISVMRPYALTAELLAGSRAIVLHDMPMHEGFEIERDVIEAHLETILHQAENRRHVAKGIFLELLGAGAT